MDIVIRHGEREPNSRADRQDNGYRFRSKRLSDSRIRRTATHISQHKQIEDDTSLKAQAEALTAHNLTQIRSEQDWQTVCKDEEHREM